METKLLILGACILLASLLLMIFTWEKGGLLFSILALFSVFLMLLGLVAPKPDSSWGTEPPEDNRNKHKQEEN
jgi:hypothetical protein